MDLYDAYRAIIRRTLRIFLKRRFASFGRGSSYDPATSVVSGYANFYIGNDVFIGPQAFLSADGVRVDIGDDTVIGPGLYLVAGDHEFETPGTSFAASPRGCNEPIAIGCNVWVGARATILKGVTIGEGRLSAPVVS